MKKLLMLAVAALTSVLLPGCVTVEKEPTVTSTTTTEETSVQRTLPVPAATTETRTIRTY